MEKEIDYNKVITGFQFNVGWLLTLSQLVVALNKPEELAQVATSKPEEFKALVKPLHMLFTDCLELCKEQGVNLIPEEPQTSQPAQSES